MSVELPEYNLSPEQAEFRRLLRRFFEEHAPMARVRSVMETDSGRSSELWKQVCEDLGLAGLAIPEAEGGQGFGLEELGIAFGEAGRALAPMPLFASAALAARAVEAVSEAPDRSGWLEPIAAGRPATLAWVEDAGGASLAATATQLRGRGRLSGEKRYVLDAESAERFFVVARAAGSVGHEGLGLYAVEADAPGVSVQRLESFDPTRRLARVRFDATEARCVGEAGPGAAMLVLALAEATALLCAEMLGGMERVLETAVDYATSRYQFGRPIGSFQAIKHKAADMLIDFEGARTATAAAIEVFDVPESTAAERLELVSVAKAHTGPAYLRMTTENIQIHGGVGYTWEYDAHLFFRRAHSSAILLGDASWHRDRLSRSFEARLGRAEAR